MKTIGTLLLLIFLAMQVSSQTKVIAHRGFSSVAPENTLAAFQKAIDVKADYFELDVHKTLDDSIIVIHDASIDKTSSNGMKGQVVDMNYSELDDVRVGYSSKFGDTYKDEKIPTLREALLLAKGKIKVCIEIKVYGAENQILDIIHDLGMRDEVILFSFYYPVLAKIRQLDNTIPILYLKGTADKLTVDYANVIEANAIGVGSGTEVTVELLDFAHQQGIEVWKWTVNDEEEMQQLVDVGIDGLITDFPDRAIANVNRAMGEK